MKLSATVANSLWIASSLPVWRHFRNALPHPASVQQEWLRAHLIGNASSEFGRTHKLTAVHSYKEFSQRVPLHDFESLEPWITRVQRGEPRVLTNERVTHLIPTSGSTGARKLIPFTVGLQRDFNRAIAPWIFDLAGQHPGILGGPAYWSISPSTHDASSAEYGRATPGTGLRSPRSAASPPPIGFADDASYLGGVKGWLVRHALITPNGLCRSDGLDAFHRATLLALLRERELRLISIWHPSFLTLLLSALPTHWNALLAAIAGEDRQRARELEGANPLHPETLWPHLRVISCWGDAHAEFGFAELQRRFPRTHLQRKGLLATEACITIPYTQKHPLALRSHFFEFATESGRVLLAHELRVGETYEVIVTTSGGLWRYRLADQVRVTGLVGLTPSLEFMGRNGHGCDLRGEKLNEMFVAAAIQRISAKLGQPTFALLSPEDYRAAVPRYILFLSSNSPLSLWQAELERELRQNPHYDYCRQLGQLEMLHVRGVGPNAGEIALCTEAAADRRLGDIKTNFISKRSNWAEVFPDIRQR